MEFLGSKKRTVFIGQAVEVPGTAMSNTLKNISKNKTVTLSSKKNIKIIDLAKTIIKLTQSKSKIIINKKKKRFDDYNSSSTELQNKKNSLTWKPKYSLTNGLKKYIDFKKNI